MSRAGIVVFFCCAMMLLPSCGPVEEVARPAAPPSREDILREGHRLFLLQKTDSAEVLLRQVVTMDSTCRPALQDLAGIWYGRAKLLEGKDPAAHDSAMRSAFRHLVRLEALGGDEAETYEQLCELALGLKDRRAFLLYAKKNAERFPYDRQFYNLGIAYFEAGEYSSCVKSQKEALEKFRASMYIGGFYRQMGRAYMKLDRNQTAERTLAAGIQAVDELRANLRRAVHGDAADPVRRLTDDKIGMLLLLKRLHTIYRADDKLRDVEQQLKEAGYGK